MCERLALVALLVQLQPMLHRDCDQQLLSQFLLCAEHLLAHHHRLRLTQEQTMCREHYRHLGEGHEQRLHRQHQVLLFQLQSGRISRAHQSATSGTANAVHGYESFPTLFADLSWPTQTQLVLEALRVFSTKQLQPHG